MLTLVRLVVAPTAKQLDHVSDLVSMFLLDVYGISLDLAVKHNWVTLVEHQLTSEIFGRHYAAVEVMDAMTEAAGANQLQLLQMLFDYNPFVSLSSACLDKDSRVDDVVLAASWTAGSSPRHPFVRAASDGHLRIVQWMVDHQEHCCTPEAAEQAARKGHLIIVKYLWAVGLVRCARCVMEQALLNGEVELVKWLDSAESDGEPQTCARSRSHCLDSITALNGVANEEIGRVLVKKGGVSVFQWFASRFEPFRFDAGFLEFAASVGDLGLVEWLFERTDICPRSAYDKELLELATELGELSMMQRLQERQKEWIGVDNACRAGHLDVVKYLVGRGCKPCSLDDAVRSGNRELVAFLIQVFGGKIDYSSDSLSASSGHFDEAGEQNGSHEGRQEGLNNSSANASAMHSGGLSIVLDEKGCLDCLGGAMDACQWDTFQDVYSEMKRKNWWNHEQLTLGHLARQIISASHREDWRYIEFLFTREEPGDTDWSVVIENAVYGHKFELIRLLYEKSARGFTDCDTLKSAAMAGSMRLMRFLHENHLYRERTDAMDEAAASGHLPMVAFLNSETRIGCSTDAMDDAAWNGHLLVVKFLHFHRDEGCTSQAVLLACSNGHLEVVKFLLTHRKEGDAQEALRVACENGHIEIIKWLVDSSAVSIGLKHWKAAESHQKSCKNVLGMSATLRFLKSHLDGSTVGSIS